MYTNYYALSDKPFRLTPDPEFLYLSRSHKEALAHLTYGVESRSGFVMVTGEVGAGKTTLLRTLIQNLGQGAVLSQVTNTRVSYKELLELILEDFGLSPRGFTKTGLLTALNEFLIERYREGKSCIVIVDEAQNLGVSTLEGLRMLSNLETEKSKLVHVILTGQPGLRDRIDSPELEQLRQRITVRYHLGPLSVGEV
ncbi:MAG: ExeA family protein, partial [Deferrisomatales bacterium]